MHSRAYVVDKQVYNFMRIFFSLSFPFVFVLPFPLLLLFFLPSSSSPSPLFSSFSSSSSSSYSPPPLPPVPPLLFSRQGFWTWLSWNSQKFSFLCLNVEPPSPCIFPPPPHSVRSTALGHHTGQQVDNGTVFLHIAVSSGVSTH